MHLNLSTARKALLEWSKRHPLATEIITVLTVKLILLILLAQFIFPEEKRPQIWAPEAAQSVFKSN